MLRAVHTMGGGEREFSLRIRVEIVYDIFSGMEVASDWESFVDGTSNISEHFLPRDGRSSGLGNFSKIKEYTMKTRENDMGNREVRVNENALAGTEPITWDGPLDVRMRTGVSRYIERKTEDSLKSRSKYWSRDCTSRKTYEISVKDNRNRFRRLVGVVDERVPMRMEKYGDETCPALLAETDLYRIFRVRWPVLANIYDITVVYGEGLLLEPKYQPLAYVVAVPDADNTPEQIAGIAEGINPDSQYARRLAEYGAEVVVPVVVDRTIFDESIGQSRREWLYRQAFHMGRHVIGYELQKVIAVVDWFEKRRESHGAIGVVGYGEGGLIAFYTAAIDTRIDAAMVSGYFDSRQRLGEEPLQRTIWGLLSEFGDAEIASLIAPRGLTIEYCTVPEVDGQRGRISTPKIETLRAEFERIESFVKPGFQPLQLIIGPEDKPVPFGSDPAVRSFALNLGVDLHMAPPRKDFMPSRNSPDAIKIQNAQMRGMEDHIQGLMSSSAKTRSKFFLYAIEPRLADFAWASERANRESLAARFPADSRWFRKHFWEEILGKIADPYVSLNPRSRRVRQEHDWIAYDIVLDVWADVIASGLLLLPSDIQEGEKRPSVVVQPGLECTPYDAIDRDQAGTWGVGARLADLGYVVFIPQNLYRGGDEFRALDKRARAINTTMWSIMIGQHEQILAWLGSLSYVDASRIGFYGCSYGGTTAMYLVSVVEGYCLSICSANFNDFTAKIAGTQAPVFEKSYMYDSKQWEFPIFNMGNTFGHAELGYLIAPRPFMVERGMYDGVAHDYSVAAEYAKVRWLYAQMDLEMKTEIEFRKEGHGFLCADAFDFIGKHLGRPVNEKRSR